MKILKAISQTTTVSIKVPDDLAERLAKVKASAASTGVAIDIDSVLAKALVRLLKQAESELAELQLGNSQPSMPADLGHRGISHG